MEYIHLLVAICLFFICFLLSYYIFKLIYLTYLIFLKDLQRNILLKKNNLTSIFLNLVN